MTGRKATDARQTPLTRSTAIKICGLRDQAAVDAVAALGAAVAYAGFVFAQSPRHITPEAFHALRLERLAARPVGVFVHPRPEDVERAMGDGRLMMLQLSGEEPAEDVERLRRRFKRPVIKAFSAMDGPEGLKVWLAGGLPPFDVLLIDAKRPGVYGGSGRRFDWALIPEWRAAALEWGVPLWIAGGLDADNVGALVRQYRPAGVDVSSGVETAGVKDAQKIARFVRAVQVADDDRAKADAGRADGA